LAAQKAGKVAFAGMPAYTRGRSERCMSMV